MIIVLSSANSDFLLSREDTAFFMLDKFEAQVNGKIFIRSNALARHKSHFTHCSLHKNEAAVMTRLNHHLVQQDSGPFASLQGTIK